jgi:hypothetical protein
MNAEEVASVIVEVVIVSLYYYFIKFINIFHQKFSHLHRRLHFYVTA